MRKLRGRTWFVLLFAFLLTVGMGVLMARYVSQGAEWADFPPNQHMYQNGRINTGSITDRNGILLYDSQTEAYADSKDIRKATLHVVGDDYGNIVTGAKRLFSAYMASYNPITGCGKGGNQVSLSIDAQLNIIALNALDGHKGAVGVYNYETGEILCLVSSPTFDPRNSAEVLDAVNAGDPAFDTVYLNHFISSSFTPGSIFKVVTTAAAIEQLHDEFHFTCTGALELGNDVITCPSVHGEVDLAGALSNSCNGAYAQLSLMLGGDVLHEYAKSAGLLDPVSINGLLSSSGSYLPVSDPAQLGWSGVGQSTDLVNPCSMLTLMGCIAGEGSAAAPSLLKSVTNDLGLPAAILTKNTSSIGWKEETCQLLKEMMRNNVVSHYGQEQFGDLAVCAKSGTAEVGPELKPHAWFVGFVDDPAHPYAFVVLVENGGWGSKTAGSVAATVLNAIEE